MEIEHVFSTCWALGSVTSKIKEEREKRRRRRREGGGERAIVAFDIKGLTTK